MTAIVGIDAAILFATIQDAKFADQTAPYTVAATEFPAWNSVRRIWSWMDPGTPTVGSDTFHGSGLDDLTPGGTYSGTRDSVYTVKITTTGTPDEFMWRRDDGAWSTETAITGSAQTLEAGITITFGATTGHTLNDYWTFPVTYFSSSPWVFLPERNELSLSISVDIAEHKPFVSSLDYAWVGKARTWMNWSGSFSGFYDDADDTIFSTMKAGLPVWMVIYDSRAVTPDTGYDQAIPPKAWFGKALLTTVDHTTGSEDFATLDVDFEGLDELYRIEQV